MNMSYPSDQGGIAADERLRSTTGADAGIGTGSDASNLASEAGGATRHVVDVAKDETRGVASEARRQARQFAGRVQGELRTQAATQQSRLAGGLQDTGSSFSKMADSADTSGYAPELVRAAGERVEAVGRWLDARDPGALVDEVKSFARRRPGVFLAIAAGAGVIIGRLTRALATPSEEPARPAAVPSPDGRAAFDAPPVTPPQRVQPPATTTVGAGAVSGNGVHPGEPFGSADTGATGPIAGGIPPEPGEFR